MTTPPPIPGASSLAGQVVVVTGAGRGLGRAYAVALAARGARVVVNDYGGDHLGTAGSTDVAEDVVGEIRRAGGEAVADGHDVSCDGAKVVAHALDVYGGLHGLINNAGVGSVGRFDEIESEDFDRVIAIHLGGTVATCRAAWPWFRTQGYGRIVNTSSASVFGIAKTSAYITAKAGVIGLTRALAQEGKAIDVKVNCIMPSAYSRLTSESGRFADVMRAGFPPEKAAPFVLALVSSQVPCSGETFVVGGGRAARVTLGTVPGARELDSVETALHRFAQVLDAPETFIPADTAAEIGYECAQLALNDPAAS